MQIGAFAALCGTKISVLRHYDREDLLVPAYVDPMTGYRHYAPSQAAVFVRITALKRAGFSLGEIRQMLVRLDSDGAVLALFEEKQARLQRMLSDLEEAKQMMMGEVNMLQVKFQETNDGIRAQTAPFAAASLDTARRQLDGALAGAGYQRVTACRVGSVSGAPEEALRYLYCGAVKLGSTPVIPQEPVDLPFEDDASVVGKWEIIGEYAVKEDFTEGISPDTSYWGERVRALYFLPGGAWYWCYGWTKGKLLCRYGDMSYVCDYETEMRCGVRHMFVYDKSWEYRLGGQPTVRVLRQCDNRAYTADEIARRDNVDMPFAEDDRVLGRWRAVDFVRSPDAFDLTAPRKSPEQLFFRETEFLPDGEVVSVYGTQTVSGRKMQRWTRGYVLRLWNSTACAYEIREIGGTEYLFCEWKSGDYTFGGMEPQYYVFARA